LASPRMIKMTAELLHSYSEAALTNADDLLAEASLLYENGHAARAYFLAIACVEETGKALLSFDAQTRNLSDPAVCTRLKRDMENHGRKITYALGRWALGKHDPREGLKVAFDLINDLSEGREPSMYTDLCNSPDRVQTPREVIRSSAARDCIRLASHCLAYAHKHVLEASPLKFSAAHDKLFTMKSAKFQQILSVEDFWWYYISRLKAGQADIAEACLGYEQQHLNTGVRFHTAD